MDYNPGVDFSSGKSMVFIPGKGNFLYHIVIEDTISFEYSSFYVFI